MQLRQRPSRLDSTAAKYWPHCRHPGSSSRATASRQAGHTGTRPAWRSGRWHSRQLAGRIMQKSDDPSDASVETNERRSARNGTGLGAASEAAGEMSGGLLKNGLPTLRWDQYTSLPPAPTVQLRLRSGDDALFHLFLAVNTQARPRHRIQPLEVQFLPARRAFPKTAFANPRKRVDHQLQLGAVGVALVEQ